jgi:hypothetical protein
MDVASLITRIDGARGDRQRASDLLAEARSMGRKEEPQPPEPPKEGLLDKLGGISGVGHTVLDVAGLIPVVGSAADLINAGWYAAEGDYKNAGLSLLGAVPGVGDAATAIKLGVKGADAAIGAAKAADDVADVAKAGDAIKPTGGSGPSLGHGNGKEYSELTNRSYDPQKSGGPVLDLSTTRITDKSFKPGGVDAVERHVLRFGENPAEQHMVQRLRDIVDPSKATEATQQDKNFYAHELRESVRYRKEGFPSDGEQLLPNDEKAAAELWESTHTASLEDYGMSGRKEELYHPDALAAEKAAEEELFRRMTRGK